MVQTQKVTFFSEGCKLVGNLFKPDNYKEGHVLPAVVLTGPMTGVKDQVAGLYGKRIAEGGLITLAFDHRHFGESEGEPRQHEDPAKKIEDLKNAITYLSSLPEVDSKNIGACGICMGGGYVLELTAFDRRVNAATIIASGFNLAGTGLESFGKEGFIRYICSLNEAREKEHQSGEVQYIPAIATDERLSALVGDEPFQYYGTSRSWSPWWINRYTIKSMENLMSYNAIMFAEYIAHTPLLIIHGKNDNYCWPKFAQEVYDKADEPKEILWLDTTNHIDLYDNEKYVGPAVEKTIEWFKKYLVN